MKRRRSDLIALVLLTLLVTVFFAGEIFTDRTLVTFRLTNVFPWLSEASQEQLEQPSVTSDCTFSYFPRRVFATDMVRQGELPFWNPHQFCGTPFLAAFQTAVLYPVNIPLYLFDPATQMDLFLYIHFVIAAVFTFLLSRKLALSLEASVISALVFTFCGFMVTRYGQPTFVSTASWLPALLFFGEHLLERPGLRRTGLLVLGISLCILAGFPQLAMFNIYALVAYMIVRVMLDKRRTARGRGAVLGLVVVALGLAAMVSAFQLLPTWELSTFSFRKTLPYEMVLSSAHHKLVSLKYVVPDILGNPRDAGVLSKELVMGEGEAVFQQNYVSTTGYIGVLPLLLAIVALAGLRRKAMPFVVLAAISLLVVFGTPLLYIFYRLLPGFNFSRIDRVIVVYMCSFAVLAGFGFDAALANGKRRFLAGIGFIGFAVGFTAWFRAGGWRMIHSRIAGAISAQAYLAYGSHEVYIFLVLALLSGLLVVTAGKRLSRLVVLALAVGLLLADLIPNAMSFKVSQPAGGVVPPSTTIDNLKSDTGTWRFAKFGAEVIPSNTATIVGLEDIHGYDALNVNRYMEVLGALDSTMIAVSNAALRRRIGPIADRRALESGILDMLNVKYIMSVADLGGPRPEPVGLLNEGFLPRAYLVEKARCFDSDDEVLAYMKSGEFYPASEVLLVGRHEETRESPWAAPPGQLSILEYGPQRLVADVDARGPCYLFVSDVHYPGWRAFVDDERTEVLRANYAFRAVKIGPGRHQVRMEYVPVYFRIGLIFSAAGIGLTGLLIASRRRFG